MTRIVDLRVKDIWSRLKNKASAKEWFSLTLKSKDVIDTAELLFIQGVNAKFEVAKKIISLCE